MEWDLDAQLEGGKIYRIFYLVLEVLRAGQVQILNLKRLKVIPKVKVAVTLLRYWPIAAYDYYALLN